MNKKSVIFQGFFSLFVLCLFLFTNSCSRSVENCKWSPDYERIGESVLESMDNMKEIEIRAAMLRCGF
jgi:hypothetical protein